MKWLLITTIGRNPGDEFARLGVERIIKETDPAATIELLDKETEPTPWKRREFDRCVLCGMPLFWDNEVSNNAEIGWWKEIFRGWPSQNKSRFAIVGVGDVFSKPPVNQDRYERSVIEAKKSAAFITTRATVPYVSDNTRNGIIDSVCPAAFVNYGRNAEKTLRIFNIMPFGAHDTHFNLFEAGYHAASCIGLVERLSGDGFIFIPHNTAELQLATELQEKLGRFPTLVPRNLQEYVDAYAKCSEYIGNRMHGAVITLGGGGAACAIGYDSRVNMVTRLGGVRIPPSASDKFIYTGNPNTQLIGEEYERVKGLLQKFAK